MGDIETLKELNERFIQAFRLGCWELLQPILSPAFSYLDGATGEVWQKKRYIEDLRINPLPTLRIDEVVIHVAGDVAVASAPSSTSPARLTDTSTRTGEARMGGVAPRRRLTARGWVGLRAFRQRRRPRFPERWCKMSGGLPWA